MLRRRYIARRVNRDLTEASFSHVHILQTYISLFTCASIIASFWKHLSQYLQLRELYLIILLLISDFQQQQKRMENFAC